MTVEDLILQAGGLLEAAATTRVEVSRRVKDPKSTVFSGTIGQNFSFDLKDGLLVGKAAVRSILSRLMKCISVKVRLTIVNRL